MMAHINNVKSMGTFAAKINRAPRRLSIFCGETFQWAELYQDTGARSARLLTS